MAFSESVANVDAADLLVNGVPASVVSSTTNTTDTLGFTQPPFGPVRITWAVGHGITDFDDPPRAFDGSGPGATFNYSLLNPNAPTEASQMPLAGAPVNSLTQVTVAFSKAVTGVDAADLRINGVPATSVSGGPVNFVFTFSQPAYGPVAIAWATNHGITDYGWPANLPFDATGTGATWGYNLVDRIAPVVAAKNPPAGAVITNLTAVNVIFNKTVTGVDAVDFLVNGVPAFGLSGGSSNYTFTFAQPPAGPVTIAFMARGFWGRSRLV